MSTSKLSGRRLMAGAAALPLLIGALSVATASSAGATANACTHPAWSNVDGGSGTGIGSSTPIRTGPSSDCPITATVGTSVVLYYHCYVTNSVGNTWTHVRIEGTQINGWVYDGNLDDNGATHHC